MSKAKKEGNKPNPEIGKRLQQQIQSKGFTQAEIARKLNYSNNAISNLIHGYNHLTRDTAERIGNILGCRPEYLLCESDYPSEHMKNLIKNINEKNIELGYYNQFFSPDIIIMYEDELEAFRLTNKKTKEIRYAKKDQLDDYCKYVQSQTSTAQKLMWDLLENQIEYGRQYPAYHEMKIERGINPKDGKPFEKKYIKDKSGKWKEINSTKGGDADGLT